MNSADRTSLSKVSETRPRRHHRDPLTLRIYFQRHLTALVRLFGHQELPVEEAREKLRPLAEEFGEDLMNEATEEVLSIVRNHPVITVRLSEETRRLARPLIGPPPDPAVAEPPVSFREAANEISEEEFLTELSQEDPKAESRELSQEREPETTAAVKETPPSPPKQRHQPSRRPVTLPMREVRVHFENWLRETGQNGVTVDAGQRAEFSDKRLGTLDAVVYGEKLNRLVTIRRTVSRLQIHDMLEWAKVFGADYRPYSVWPEKGSDGWIWDYQPIVSDSPGSR